MILFLASLVSASNDGTQTKYCNRRDHSENTRRDGYDPLEFFPANAVIFSSHVVAPVCDIRR
jgi:hypothetical protein